MAYLNFLFCFSRDFVSNALIVMLMVSKLTFDCNPKIMYDMTSLRSLTPLGDSRDVNASSSDHAHAQYCHIVTLLSVGLRDDAHILFTRLIVPLKNVVLLQLPHPRGL